MKSASYKFAGFKYQTIDFLYRHKIKIYICLFCLVLGILTGVFTAIKMFNTDSSELFDAFNITTSISEIESLSANFFGRLVSCEIVAILLLLFSQTIFTEIFGYCLITYRAFLVSINCVSLVIIYSFGGVLKAILIILPCQLIMLFVLCMYFCYNNYLCIERRKYRSIKAKDFIFPFLIVSAVLGIANILETVLLFVFQSNVILVI